MSAGKQNFKSGAGGEHVNRKEELDQHPEEHQEGEFGERDLSRSVHADCRSESSASDEAGGEEQPGRQGSCKKQLGYESGCEEQPGHESGGQIQFGHQGSHQDQPRREGSFEELISVEVKKAVCERPSPAQPTWPFSFTKASGRKNGQWFASPGQAMIVADRRFARFPSFRV